MSVCTAHPLMDLPLAETFFSPDAVPPPSTQGWMRLPVPYALRAYSFSCCSSHTLLGVEFTSIPHPSQAHVTSTYCLPTSPPTMTDPIRIV